MTNKEVVICSPVRGPRGRLLYACTNPYFNSAVDLFRRAIWEKANDQIDRCCCLRLGRRNIGASNDTGADSSAGRHDHASRLVMRAGHDTS